jgi:restriction endonuclease-like protein
MQALHSSSALVCNVFDYWRGKNLARLGRALSTPETPRDFKFEQKYSTGLRGSPANLDVVISFAGPKVLAIESKYTEPYGNRQPAPWPSAYFPIGPGLWEKHGLLACEALARSLNDGAQTFARLDAAQLLKHILGLTHQNVAFTLLYLWYDWPSEEAASHR